MGNCVDERKPTLSLFDPIELAALNRIFDERCDLNPNTRKNRLLAMESFEELFPENPEFGRKLFRLLEVYGQREQFVSRELLFSALECLIKDTAAAPQLKSFDRLELTTLISLKNTQFLANKEELHALRIPYLDAVIILNDLLRIRLAHDPLQTIDERVTRAFLDQLYVNSGGLLEWYELVRHLKAKLRGISSVLKQYFQHKFMGKSLPVLTPALSTESYLLNEDWLFTLHLAAYESELHNSIKLELLYSNRVHQGGFQQMVDAMLASGLPTIMMFQHEEFYPALQDKSVISKANIFGALSNLRWQDSGLAYGQKNDCIFQMCPNLMVYSLRRDKSAKRNFCYLNVSDKSKPVGVGFGYDDGKARIWIDEDMFSRSYVASEDQTFEKGDLVSKHVKKLELTVVEVWAIVHIAAEEQPELNEDPVVQQEVVELNPDLDSRADYYWVNSKEEVVEKTGDFYWVSQQEEIVVTRTKMVTSQINGGQQINAATRRKY